ncbi:MAG: DUF1488 domain-containing protein [Oxalobacteraceae bacterium]|nr:MAG: DUF1488 domain-containing protein [Oxalobacteraceae bacterium]
MGVSFPNQTRSFDGKNRCVRFTGYDGMFEIKFYLAVEVLASERAERNTSEIDYLTSFDALRPRILKAATSEYSRSRSSTIMLNLTNFD